MNYRLVSTFGSGSCVSSFGSNPKVETAAVSIFGPAQALLGTVLGKETYERLNGWKTRTSVH